jgi:predicted protein tyrosine phosphatase
MENRKHNAKNPAQGEAKKVLCVCSAGLLRSPTLAFVLAKELGYNTRACGSTSTFALIQLDEVLMHWADEIVFVNKENFQEALNNYESDLDEDKCVVLNIPDQYTFMHPDLQDHCLNQYKEKLNVSNK